MHSDKTKIVYCKDGNRRGKYPNMKFDFLGYCFRPRTTRNRKRNEVFTGFGPQVSASSLKTMRQKIRMLLPTAGNSHTSERTELLDRLRAAFPDMKVAALMGDREFIGDAWMAYLQRENIPFVLRLRENQHVLREGYAAMSIAAIARHLRTGERMIVKGGCRLGRHDETLSASVPLVVTRLGSGELLALACSGSARHALARYRQRWTIETMFGNLQTNLKTKGFALEATHLTNPDKLCTLLALMAFAVALTVKTGVAMERLHAIPIKKHGRRAWSLFALGLNTLRKIFVAASPDQIIEFLDQLLSPKLPVKAMRSLAFR